MTDAHSDHAISDAGAESYIGHGVLVGSIVGVLVSFIGSGVGMLIAGVEPGGAAGFGLFVAFWGGLGFGSMMGGVSGFIRAMAAAGEHHL
ncbi:MAG: hypothetical protein GXY13_04160 [Acidimicrobiales bacterium]|nr:hypothetical protein [Acidimicrobiales bacterium]